MTIINNEACIMKNLVRAFKNFCKFWNDFGVLTACGVKIGHKLTGDLQPQHRTIIRYLKRNYKELIEEYQHKNFTYVEGEIPDDCPIWVCWFQGEEQMPPIVKVCFQHVQKHRGRHEVRLITMANLKDWVFVPAHIMTKVRLGEITLTHFSDFVRNALLAEHGGIWVDATLYLTKDLKGYPYPFYTIKQNKPADHVYVSEYRWTTFFLCGMKGNPLNSFVRDMLSAYIRKERTFIDYYLFDYVIAVGYETIPAIRQMIDKVPYSNPHLHGMQLEQPVDVGRLQEMYKDTSIFKVTYKIAPPEDKRALYYYLLKDEIIH